MRKQLYIIDGYNMIGAWPALVALKNQDDLESARDLLLDMCSNFRKFEGIECWVVFDAQFVPGLQTSFDRFEVKVIFSSQEETADQCIERLVHQLNTRLVQVSVATSDLAEQWMIFQRGALRKSAHEFYREIERSVHKQRDLAKDFAPYGRRRRSPWNQDQWQALDRLRYQLQDQEKEVEEKDL